MFESEYTPSMVSLRSNPIKSYRRVKEVNFGCKNRLVLSAGLFFEMRLRKFRGSSCNLRFGEQPQVLSLAYSPQR